MPTIRGPHPREWPQVGMEGLGKGRPRADFREEQLFSQIERAARVVWSRAAECPCRPINEQTAQPNPNCELGCRGTGYILFGPHEDFDLALMREDIGQLSTFQERLIKQNEATVIYAQVVTFTSRPEALNVLGPWVFGSANITVRPENVLGYRDRIIMLDAVMTYSEVVEVAVGSRRLETRYPVADLQWALDEDGKRRTPGQDIQVTDEGHVELESVTTKALRVGVHYLTAPTFRVTEEPNTVRQLAQVRKRGETIAPTGNPTDLPIKALMRLEHLIDGGTSRTNR